VSAGWVAAGVRARGLSRRRLGRDGVRQLAAAGSITEAVATLSRTPYGHDVRAGMQLDRAQHATTTTLVWHLRVLAGWGPAVEFGGMRVLATMFEITNVTSHLLGLDGRPAPPPMHLGSLAVAWPRVALARTPEQVRQVLAASAWGDPGASDAATVRVALQLAWARRVMEGVPEAGRWAGGFAALVVAKLITVGAWSGTGPKQLHDVRRVLGHRCQEARSVAELVADLPRSAAWVLDDIEEPDLWKAESRWWRALDAEGSALLARSRPGEASTIGAFGVLAADAWRVRAALELAARGGRLGAEDLDALA
jgi:hypothetical protein